MLIYAQLLLDCLPAQIALLDRDGVVVLVNQTWRQFGAANGQRDPSCCVGMNYLDVCDCAAAEDMATATIVARGLRSVLQGRPEFTAEYPCSSLGEVHWFSLRARRLTLDQDAWVLVMHSDISKREIAMQTADMRAAENNVYRAMIDALPDFIFAKDRQSRFIAANQATAQVTLASSPADLIGRCDADFYPPEIAAGFKADEEAFFARGETVIIEQPGRRLDGSPGWLCSLKSPLMDAQGRVVGYVGHGRDVTDDKLRDQALADARLLLERQAEELRVMTEAAERASQIKSDFLAAMSHEIRTPMTGVLGMADLLATENLSPTQKGYIDTIRVSGQHLLSVINSILDFSRVEAGKLELEQIDFSPAEVLERVQSIMAAQAAERGLQLRVEYAAASVVVRGDPTRLQQVLLNLVGNGLKFTAEGSVTLTVLQLATTTTGEVRLRFEVQDDGIGIPLERQAELFQPFVQADRTTTRQYGGSGLGLAICRRLVEAMDGVIGLNSEPGRGSLFWVELPFALGDAEMAVQRGAFEPVQIRPLHVLVVDDVAVNRELLAEMLGRYGHEVLLAPNGAVALELAAAAPLDVVLMDIQMPVMDGMEATRRIRLLPEPACTVPIVALTANVMITERNRYLAAGMDQCLTKPVVWPELFAVLAKVATGDRLGTAARTQQSTSIDADATLAALPLLDMAMLKGMAQALPPAVFRQLLARGLDNAEHSHQQMAMALGDPILLAQEAHRLRGTSGSFGLMRIASLVGAIEEQVGHGRDVADLVVELQAVIAATRDAVAPLKLGTWTLQ